MKSVAKLIIGVRIIKGLFNSQYAVWVHQFVCPNVSLVQLLLNRLTYTDETLH